MCPLMLCCGINSGGQVAAFLYQALVDTIRRSAHRGTHKYT